MFMFFDFDDLRSLGSIIDKYFEYRDHEYEDLVDKIIFDYPDSSEALVELLTYVVFAPFEELERVVNAFLGMPLEEMKPYSTKPVHKLQRASCPCPSPEEGPYAWQTVLARWRLQLQR